MYHTWRLLGGEINHASFMMTYGFGGGLEHGALHGGGEWGRVEDDQQKAETSGTRDEVWLFDTGWAFGDTLLTTFNH